MIEIRKATRIDREDGRFYTSNDQDWYPSATTVLNDMRDHEWLEDWRKRVGEEEANRISWHSRSRGTRAHAALERFTLGDENAGDGLMPDARSVYRGIVPYLRENLSKVISTEIAMTSDTIRVGGTADLIGVYGGENAVVDYKNSLRPKFADQIVDYFIQCGMYAHMARETFARPIGKIVVLIGVFGGNGQEFVESARPWMDAAKEISNEWWKQRRGN